MNDRLRELRRERGCTQKEIQLLTGIDRGNYSKMELGKRYYTFGQCRRLAVALETSMDYLAELTDEKRPYDKSKLSLSWPERKTAEGSGADESGKEKKLPPQLCGRLLELRSGKRYTQVRMQTLTGVDQSNYSKLERGEVQYTFEQCRLIALAMNTSMDYLAGLTDRKKPHKRRKGISG